MTTLQPKDNFTSISISRNRLNGLKLRTIRENRRTPANTLDTILRDNGIPELTEQEFKTELKRLNPQTIKNTTKEVIVR